MSFMSELDIMRQELFAAGGTGYPYYNDPPERVTKPVKLAKQCGVYATAKYLRNRGYDINQALVLLGLGHPAPQPVRSDVPTSTNNLPNLLRRQAW